MQRIEYNSHSYHFQDRLKDTMQSTWEKVKKIACAIFETCKTIVTFPLRYSGCYMGTKTWSPQSHARTLPKTVTHSIKKRSLKEMFSAPASKGYHTEMTPLAPEQLPPYLPYGAATLCSHKFNPDWIKPWDMKLVSPKEILIDTQEINPSLEARETCFFNPTTSLKAVIIETGLEVIIAYGALEAGENEVASPEEHRKMHRQQLSFFTANLVGFQLSLFTEANKLYQAVQNSPQFAGKPIVTTGLCWGGTLAQYTALKNAGRAVCFNCAPLGVGLQADIGADRLKEADAHVTHISAQTDFVSDTFGIKWIDKVFTLKGIRTPGNFGKRYVVPSAYNALSNTHKYFMGSLLNHLGYDKRTQGPKISPEHIVMPARYDEYEMTTFWDYNN